MIATTGGVIVTAAEEHGAGDPAPFRFSAINPGGSIPKGVALVMVRAQMPAGPPPAGQRRSVTLSCPKGMKYANPASNTEQRADVRWDVSEDAIHGVSTRARIDFANDILPQARAVDVGIECRKPAANGSIIRDQRLPKPGERAGRMCARHEYLRRTAGGIFAGVGSPGRPARHRRPTDRRLRGVLRAVARGLALLRCA